MRYFNKAMEFIVMPFLCVFNMWQSITAGDALYAAVWAFIGGMFFMLLFNKALNRYLRRRIDNA